MIYRSLLPLFFFSFFFLGVCFSFLCSCFFCYAWIKRFMAFCAHLLWIKFNFYSWNIKKTAPRHSFEATKKIIQREYGRPLDDVFEHFDTQPVASGAIAQVHRYVYFLFLCLYSFNFVCLCSFSFHCFLFFVCLFFVFFWFCCDFGCCLYLPIYLLRNSHSLIHMRIKLAACLNHFYSFIA